MGSPRHSIYNFRRVGGKVEHGSNCHQKRGALRVSQTWLDVRVRNVPSRTQSARSRTTYPYAPFWPSSRTPDPEESIELFVCSPDTPKHLELLDRIAHQWIFVSRSPMVPSNEDVWPKLSPTQEIGRCNAWPIWRWYRWLPLWRSHTWIHWDGTLEYHPLPCNDSALVLLASCAELSWVL